MLRKLTAFAVVLVLFAGYVHAEDSDELDLEDFDLDELERQEELLGRIAEEKLVALEKEYELKHIEEIMRLDSLDPCTKIHCGAGKVCQTEEGGKAECVCIPECPLEKDSRRRVCTSRNETWDSDCEVHRQRCLCETKSATCKDKEYNHIQINYFGECREMPPCSEEEMVDFPRRMRDWLFNVMRDLAERQELTEHYKIMKEEAETNMTKRWVNAAVWKWCDLDASHDHSVSIHELFPIRAPLMALEHCIAPFLDTCDPNGDHRITLSEWGQCLQIEEGDMQDQCEDVRNGKVTTPAA